MMSNLFASFSSSNYDLSYFTNDYNIFFIFVLFFYKLSKLNLGLNYITERRLIDFFDYFGEFCFVLLILILLDYYFFGSIRF